MYKQSLVDIKPGRLQSVKYWCVSVNRQSWLSRHNKSARLENAFFKSNTYNMLPLCSHPWQCCFVFCLQDSSPSQTDAVSGCTDVCVVASAADGSVWVRGVQCTVSEDWEQASLYLWRERDCRSEHSVQPQLSPAESSAPPTSTPTSTTLAQWVVSSFVKLNLKTVQSA